MKKLGYHKLAFNILKTWKIFAVSSLHSICSLPLFLKAGHCLLFPTPVLSPQPLHTTKQVQWLNPQPDNEFKIRRDKFVYSYFPPPECKAF